MFDEFVKQARRLFSSKSNAGKQVPKLTDQLHTLKQVLLGLSIVLVLGYSQFRDHFKCQAVSGVKADEVTNFCLTNGTSTVVDRADEGGPSQFQVQPHVGQGFVTSERDSMVIRHLYIRDLWLILIAMASFSFIATRYWAQLFQNDVLQALLKLVGSESSHLVKAADKSRPFETLSSPHKHKAIDQLTTTIQNSSLHSSERLMQTIELLDDYENVHDHKLDYYPNQLIYLLLTKGAASYKMADLKLSRKLLVYSICSTTFTLSQFLFPLLLIGRQYASYGLLWARAVFEHLPNIFGGHSNQSEGSLDYELSAFIFPLSTLCEYKAYGPGGLIDSQITQCTAAINEICSKIFPIVWWFVVINLAFELYALIWMAAASIGPSAASWIFSRRFWPGARKEANLIATFRHKLAQLQRERELLLARRVKSRAVVSSNLSSIELNLAEGNKGRKPKQIEVEDLESAGSRPRRGRANSYRRLIGRLLGLVLAPSSSKQTERRRRRLESEHQRDINIYHLLYLLHLRLGKSKSRTEEVIKMTARALEILLAETDKANELIRQQLKASSNGRPGEGHGDNLQLSIAHRQEQQQQPIIISNHEDTEGSCDELNGQFRSTSELANGSQSSRVTPNAPLL